MSRSLACDTSAGFVGFPGRMSPALSRAISPIEISVTSGSCWRWWGAGEGRHSAPRGEILNQMTQMTLLLPSEQLILAAIRRGEARHQPVTQASVAKTTGYCRSTVHTTQRAGVAERIMAQGIRAKRGETMKAIKIDGEWWAEQLETDARDRYSRDQHKRVLALVERRHACSSRRGGRAAPPARGAPPRWRSTGIGCSAAGLLLPIPIPWS